MRTKPQQYQWFFVMDEPGWPVFVESATEDTEANARIALARRYADTNATIGALLERRPL
jgi:hypothetical protein